ncbi:MAG: TIGR03087 family PEP-CTERM/XrtA system glycosyltransferase [Methylotenera sp.]|nr:TIGR03087 family PEP-CTERM/XrtA system glycosyltransferase [Methylotenera sp.]
MQDLLFLAHRIPYPPNKGDKIRSYHFLKYLSEHFNVHLGTFVDDPNDNEYTHVLDKLCTTTFYQNINPLFSKFKCLKGLLTGEPLSLPYYNNIAMQEWVNSTIKKYSINKVLVFSSVMAKFVQYHDVDMIVDFVDVDSDKWRQYAESKKFLSAWIYQRESNYLLRYEKHIAQQSKLSFFVSKQESDLFKSLAPEAVSKITYVNNGVNIDYFSPENSYISPYPECIDAIVFTGAMDYWANVDAVKWFADHVFSEISCNFPALKFYIVGSKPSKEVLALTSASIVVTGAVDDVRPYIAHAKLAVAPLRIARGIQNKVLEAMAMGKPVIATSAAMEGIAYTEKQAVFVADDPKIMAHLLTDSLSHYPSTAHNNRQFVTEWFSWEQNCNHLIKLIKD